MKKRKFRSLHLALKDLGTQIPMQRFRASAPLGSEASWIDVLIDPSRYTTEERKLAEEVLAAMYLEPLKKGLTDEWNWGKTPYKADDLVQGFFADLLSRPDKMAGYDRSRPFRPFLLTLLFHYCSHDRRDSNRKKRKPKQLVPLDEIDPRAQDPTPPHSYEREKARRRIHEAVELARTRVARVGDAGLLTVFEEFVIAHAHSRSPIEELARKAGLDRRQVERHLRRVKESLAIALREIAERITHLPAESVDSERDAIARMQEALGPERPKDGARRR